MRKLEEKDLQTRVDWINDPRIHSTMNIPVPVTLKSTLQWYKKSANDVDRADLVLELNNKIVAMSGLYGRTSNSAEGYTFVMPGLKGRGIGSKALLLRTIWGFKITKLEEITSIVDVDNVASRRSVEKLGYKLLEIRRGELEKQGRLIDRCYYSLNENDFDFSQFNYSIDNGNIEIEIYE